MFKNVSRIHFLNTGHSDCIILESNGLFAMIDAAEDTDYPLDKPHLKLPGYEDIVVKYINEHCKGNDGKITFEFILGTHAHSDHIGGFDTVINQPNVFIKKAYLKPYVEERIIEYERKRWDNLEVYQQMVNALNKKNIPIIQSFNRVCEKLGSFNVVFYNGAYVDLQKKTGENRNSVITLVEKDGLKAVLAGDMNYSRSGEKTYAPVLGKVDILKVGHHGYTGSTSSNWLKHLMPQYAIVCNSSKRINPDVRLKLKTISKSRILCTENENGIIAEFDKDIKIITDIM